VQGREAGSAEELDDREVQHQSRRSGDLAFDVGGQDAAVRRVDLTPDRDENCHVRKVACAEGRSVVLFAPVERIGVGSEHTAGT